jgi:predicted nucleic acid-binding protein
VTQRLIAADASPLIGMAAAGAFELLRDLYGTVTITKLVKDEVTGRADLPGARELDAAMRAGWIRVAATPPETWAYRDIDAGEASTIALALTQPGALVLMDDVLGRARAHEAGLETVDVIGLLVAAKRARLIEGVRPVAERLARRGFTVPPEALRAALAEAGELDPRDA